MEEKQVLDSGYCKLVESWGTDAGIVECARMSTQKGFNGWGTPDAPGDEKLLRFLWEHKHTTPFEFGGATFEVKLPIFVAREWQRHRTLSYSEASARYAPLPNESYVPTAERIETGSAPTKNRQASGLQQLSSRESEEWSSRIRSVCAVAHREYNDAIALGVPKEIARLILPVGTYTKMRVTGNLRNWLAFLKLRLEASAQFEIRVYAQRVEAELEQLFPRTLGLFKEGV